MPRGYITAFSPLPNIVIPSFPRTLMHVATINVAGGTVTLVAGRSSLGIGFTDNGAGDYTISFPAGGAGAFGFTMISVENLNNADIVASVSTSTAANYVTGVVTVNTKTTATATDVVGNVVCAIFVVQDPLVAI